MTDCAIFRERVFELIEDLLPATEATEAREHAAACADCGRQLESARKFEDLLANEGSRALEGWKAHVITRDVLAWSAREVGRPVAAEPARRRGGLRLLLVGAGAAAAAVLVTLAVSAGAGPRLLAEDDPVVLERGQTALAGPGREAQGEDAARMVVAHGSGGALLRLEIGSALFRVEPGRAFAVETPQGTASVLGTSFHVAVQEDHAVSVAVHSGRVRFARTGSARTLGPGDRLEIDARGTERLVSAARIAELEASLARAEREVRRLSEEAGARVDRPMAAADVPIPGTVEDPLDASALPWDQLGVAMRDLLAPSRGWGPSKNTQHLKSLGIVFEQADGLRRLTAESDPQQAVWHPASLARLAEPFCKALAPDATSEARAATVAAITAAAREALSRSPEDLVPTEVSAERVKLRRALLVAVRDNLGAAPAAEIARSIGGAMRMDWRLLSVFPMPLTDHTAEDIEAWWTKRLKLDDTQRPAVLAAIRAYVDRAVAAQSQVVSRLGAEEVAPILFPRWPAPPAPNASVTGPSASGQAAAGEAGQSPEMPKGPPQPPDDASSVANVLRALDVRLEIAQPRIEFERTLRSILRPEQMRSAAMFSGPLATFREAQK